MVGGKLESNGILDEENLDDDLKVFYIHSTKVRQMKNKNLTKIFLFSIVISVS